MNADLADAQGTDGTADEHLVIWLDKSELHSAQGDIETFPEGPQSTGARTRYRQIRSALEEGYLRGLIPDVLQDPALVPDVPPEARHLLDALVEAVTSECGRALVGLTVLQLTIKAICPEQSIRLHKGAGRHGGDRFSWQEGLSMRSLDRNYITPVLRQHDLLHLNADGFMMTRSLAENYPYSRLYKAALRGGRQHWLELTSLIEGGALDAGAGLRYLIALLVNRSDAFNALAEQVLALARSRAETLRNINATALFMLAFVASSSYSARLFEIAMHSLYQVLEELRCLPNFLEPLSQMRSANKKHGNIGDVELVARPGTQQIVESYDAKYGKPYLRDELEELAEKLGAHPETEIAGFVVDQEPNRKREIVERSQELEALHGVEIPILSFPQWVEWSVSRAVADGADVARRWLVAFAECLCQRRRAKAPIDEPCGKWLEELRAALS